MQSRTNTSTPDLEALKGGQQGICASVDFVRIGVRLRIVKKSLCETVDLRSCDNVLDMAAGTGRANSGGGDGRTPGERSAHFNPTR